jgi:hypothetical protein
MKNNTIIRALGLLLCLVFCSFRLMAQAPTMTDSVVIGNVHYKLRVDTSKYLSYKNFKRYINNMFGQVAVGSYGGTDMANYATIEPMNGSFSFNGFGSATEETAAVPVFFSLNVKGRLLGNNTVALFDNSKLNTDASAQLKLHIGFPRKHISYLEDERITLLGKKDSLLKDALFQLEQVKNNMALNGGRIANAHKQELVNAGRQQQVQLQLNAAIAKRDAAYELDSIALYTDSCSRLQSRKDQLVLEAFRIGRKLDSLQSDAGLMGQVYDPLSGEVVYSNRQYQRIKKALKAAIDTIETKASVASVGFFWGTVNLGFGRKKYYTYDSKLPFEDQISKRILDAVEIGGAVNYFYHAAESKRTFYGNLGLSRVRSNNIDDLSATQVDEVTQSAGGSTARTVKNSYSVYTDPVVEFKTWMYYLNLYYMWGKKDKCGLHVFPSYEDRQDLTNTWNAGFGYIFSFKDKKDNKTIINLEAFVKFLDIDNKAKADSRFYERNRIGVSVGVPFNFIF